MRCFWWAGKKVWFVKLRVRYTEDLLYREFTVVVSSCGGRAMSVACVEFRGGARKNSSGYKPTVFQMQVIDRETLLKYESIDVLEKHLGVWGLAPRKIF